MLIEFKVANFRSIRDEQSLSLVASNYDKELPEVLVNDTVRGLSGTRFLRVAAIYGANASGKSNLWHAWRFFTDFLIRSSKGIEPDESTKVSPFKLDSNYRDRPSVFELSFIKDGVRYRYCLSLTMSRVVREALFAFPKGKENRWFEREYDCRKDDYKWSKPSVDVKPDKLLESRVKNGTSAYLSVASQFSHPKFSEVYLFIKQNMRSIVHLDRLQRHFTESLLDEEPMRVRILELLQKADLGVVDIEYKEEPLDEEYLHSQRAVMPPSLFDELLDRLRNKEGVIKSNLDLIHLDNDAVGVPFDLISEESEGTKTLFAMAGPIIDVLDNGRILFVDEIERSLHPLLVREIVRMFQNPLTNPKGAQLIFTTHSTVLMDRSLLRRDQIWFTEKDQRGATSLYSLSDYKPRNDEAIQRGYLAGRYGAVPNLAEALQ